MQLAILLTLLPLCAAPAAGVAQVVRAGKHFRVICHFDHAASADQALAVVEAAWPIAHELIGRPRQLSNALLDVHLYPDAAAYETVEAGITKGRFKDNLSFAAWDTKAAHVAVQPDSSRAALDEHGLSFLTLRTLAHEAAHLTVFATTNNYRSHPDWYSEGMALQVEKETMRACDLLESVADAPDYATHAAVVRRLRAEGRLPTIEATLTDGLDGLSSNERYALRGLLLEFLLAGKEGRATRTALKEVTRLGGSDALGKEARELLLRKLGRGRNGLEDRFGEFIDALDPHWSQDLRHLDTSRTPWLHAAFGGQARAWRLDRPADAARFELCGAVRLLGDARRLGFLLGRADGGWLAIGVRENGTVDALSQDGPQAGEQPLAHASYGAPRADGFVDLQVRVDGPRVQVIAGEGSLECAVDDLTGQWGLFADGAAAGYWRDVALRPLQPR